MGLGVGRLAGAVPRGDGGEDGADPEGGERVGGLMSKTNIKCKYLVD